MQALQKISGICNEKFAKFTQFQRCEVRQGVEYFNISTNSNNIYSMFYLFMRIMSPSEWIRQTKWIKIANIHFSKHCKQI